MKNLLRFLAIVLTVGGAYAQSNLPACQGTDESTWTNCFGTATYTKDKKYPGEFKVDDESQYVGEWKDGNFNGQGIEYRANGYGGRSGIWTRGKYIRWVGLDRNSFPFNPSNLIATSNPPSSAERDRLTAEVATATQQPNISQSNLPACRASVSKWNNCSGTQTYPNGNKYIGEFKNNKFNGQGTAILDNGDKYVGEFKDDEFNGQGTFIYANGHKYIGSFKDDKRNGLGTLYAVNGSVISQGIWTDGKFVRPSPVQQSSVAIQAVPLTSVQPNAASSNPSDCQGSDQKKWHFCTGTEDYDSGVLRKFVGIYLNGERNGVGIEYAKDGSVLRSGTWKGFYRLVTSHAVDTQRFPFNSSVMAAVAPTSAPDSGKTERDRLNAEVEAERKKRQELEQRLAAAKERDQITAELDLERKKRQELEAQLAASVQPASSQTNFKRRIAHALVIGNGAYPGSGRLDNPVNDANAISLKLRSMGFTVTTVTDANRQRLVQSMAQFRRTAASADISLLYYAGHGVQIFGTNYILPTDVDQTDPAQATIQGVSLNSVVENFLPGKTKLVFLDACRDNALQRTNDRSVSKGLAPISAAEGTLISYATKDGQTAADGVGSKNSPFTQALLEHLNDPQDIAVVLRKVRERVMKITGGKQQPWEYGSLTGGELVLSAIKLK